MSDDDDRRESSSGRGLWLLGVVLLPGALLAGGLYGMLRWRHTRPQIIGLLGWGVSLLSILSIFVFGLVDKALGVFQDMGSFSDNWVNLLPLWIAGSLAIGGPAGWIMALVSDLQMRRNPHLLSLAGDWRYRFTYRKTIFEMRAKKKRIAALQEGALVRDDSSPLGIDETHGDALVNRYDDEARTHLLINGQTGSGKSITQQSLILSDIITGKTVVVIDFKRSPEFAAKLSTWAHEEGREFYHFVNGDAADYDIPHSKGPCYYDPLKSGTYTAKADMVLGMREYDTSSAVYKNAMQQLLQTIFAMLHYADRGLAERIDWNGGGVAQLASVMSGNNLKALVNACVQDDPTGVSKYTLQKRDERDDRKVVSTRVTNPIAQNAYELGEALNAKTPLRNAMDELQGQMRTITVSEYGPWLRIPKDKKKLREIDLMKQMAEEGNVILFSINSDSEPDFAKFIGALILADLTNVSARRRNERVSNQVNIYVDEFQAVNPTSVTSLLEKARESRMAMTLANQSFDQIISASDHAGEAYLMSILDTCGNFITHAGATEDSAVRLAKILGKTKKASYTKTNKNSSAFGQLNRKSGQDSQLMTKDEETWKFSPEEFMSLSSPTPANGFKSTAVLINKASSDPLYGKTEGAVARRVWMIPNDRVLETYYTGKKMHQVEEVLAAGIDEEQETVSEFADPNEDHLAAYRAAKQREAAERVQDQHDSHFPGFDEDPIDDMDIPRDSYDDEYEDDDGGFSFETIEDDPPASSPGHQSLREMFKAVGPTLTDPKPTPKPASKSAKRETPPPKADPPAEASGDFALPDLEF